MHLKAELSSAAALTTSCSVRKTTGLNVVYGFKKITSKALQFYWKSFVFLIIMSYSVAVFFLLLVSFDNLTSCCGHLFLWILRNCFEFRHPTFSLGHSM